METFKNSIMLICAAIVVLFIFVAASDDRKRGIEPNPQHIAFGDYSCIESHRSAYGWSCMKYK
jgi:hypothetical protein